MRMVHRIFLIAFRREKEWSWSVKTFLLFSWLLIGGGGYFAYNFYQQSMADKDALTQSLVSARESDTDLTNQIANLKNQIANLQSELNAEKKIASSLRQAASAVATPTPSATFSSDPTTQQITPNSFPSTISTLFGKTYTGCVLSRVTPDGISITYSMGAASIGVAHILFSELDPTLAKTFGYDPNAAKQYEQQQALAEAQSDAARTAADVTDTSETATNSNPPLQSTSTQSGLSTEAKTAIQAQISDLRADISMMQNDLSRHPEWDRTRGAYPDKITQEQAQIQQLQAELR